MMNTQRQIEALNNGYAIINMVGRIHPANVSAVVEHLQVKHGVDCYHIDKKELCLKFPADYSTPENQAMIASIYNINTF